jgi:hypothetical protein
MQDTVLHQYQWTLARVNPDVNGQRVKVWAEYARRTHRGRACIA